MDQLDVHFLPAACAVSVSRNKEAVMCGGGRRDRDGGGLYVRYLCDVCCVFLRASAPVCVCV